MRSDPTTEFIKSTCLMYLIMRLNENNFNEIVLLIKKNLSYKTGIKSFSTEKRLNFLFILIFLGYTFFL